jgi:hypothetical protein
MDQVVLVVDVVYTTHTSGVRIREIDNWSLVEFAPGEYYLDGRCTVDNGVVLDFIRLTKTSPIKYREGRTLITESGSRYFLQMPAEHQERFGYKIFENRKS